MAETQTTTTQPYDLPDLNYQLPEAPSFSNPYQGADYTPVSGYQNPYQQGTAQYNVAQRYLTALGRAPENDAVVQEWARNPNWYEGIGSSPEAQTLGRARNEVNPQIDAQLQQIQNDLALQRQGAQSRINQLDPLYDQQFAELAFGNTEQQNALNTQLQQLMDDYNMQSGRLQEQYTPALLAARQSALRSGFTDASTIAGERIAAGFKPISQGLADLAVKTQTTRSDLQSKKQALQEKYLFGRENLMAKRQTDLQSILDELNLRTTQAGQQYNQTLSQRLPSTYARSGELSDALKQYDLQRRQLDELIRFQQEQNRLARDQFDFQRTR